MENNNKEEIVTEEESKVESQPEEQEVLRQDNPIIKEQQHLADSTDDVDGIILPSSTFYKITNYIEKINELTNNTTDKKINKLFTEEQLLGIGINFSSQKTTSKYDIFVENINKIDTDWSNILEYADKELSIRNIPHKASSDEKTYTSEDSIARFLNYLGKGGVIQIPLWHSGFWVTLKPVMDSDLVNLELQLANEQITLGRSTNGIAFSNYSVVFVRIVTDFILNHIENTTVKLENNEDLREFIKIQDLYPFVLGLIILMFPNGFDNYRSCKNSLVLDKDDKPKCSYIVQAKIDPKKLLWINRDILTNAHKDIMIKRAPNSISINEVKEYQNTLSVNKEQTSGISLSNNIQLDMVLQMPNLLEHINSGEEWVNGVIELVEESLTEDVNIGEKNRRINKMSKTSILNIYRHFIKSIKIDNATFEGDAISPILETIASDKSAYEEIKEDIKSYITNSNMAIVAIPNYVCPDCKSDQSSDDVNEVFKEFVPLGVLENFFDLSTFKTSMTQDLEMS